MEWHSAYASDERQIRLWRKLEREGIPGPLRTMPAISPDVADVWRSFWQLHQQRPFGGSIPITAVLAYLELIQEDDAEYRRRFFELLSSLDRVWLEIQSEQRQSHGNVNQASD